MQITDGMPSLSVKALEITLSTTNSKILELLSLCITEKKPLSFTFYFFIPTA